MSAWLGATRAVFAYFKDDTGGGAPTGRHVTYAAYAFATATNKVAAAVGDAYTLVSVQGSLWCPDCERTEANFLNLTNAAGENRFRAWAKARQIALVAADIPNYNGPDVTNRTRATLFSREAYTAADGTGRSGRAYLSRKAISDAEAQAELERLHRLAVANTAQGGFHRPEDRNANRTGVPIFVLVRKDGTVAGRFTRFASVSPTEADRGNFDAYVRRIEELIDGARDAAETVTVVDTDAPCLERLAYDASRGAAVIDGVPTRPGTYVFTCTATARRPTCCRARTRTG